MPHTLSPRSGFTLVELSISMVIIALVIGGIIGGQELMRQSELQKMQVDIQTFRSGINNFRTTYNAYPGDLTDASSYWSAATNGNGNNMVETTAEMFQGWYHLTLAKMIPGNYTGTSSDPAVAGSNVPNSPVMGVMYQMRYLQACALSGEYAMMNAIEAGGPGSSGLANTTDWISAPEAQALDRKIDDGLACRGIVRGLSHTSEGCPSWTATTGDYTVSNTKKTCGINVDITR